MPLRKRVLLGLAAVAAVLVMGNGLLATTFADSLLRRVDDQLVSTAERPTFRDAGNTNAITEFFIGRADLVNRTLQRIGSPLQQQSPPELSLEQIAANRTGFGDPMRPFTVDAQTGDGRWRVVVVGETFASDALVVGASLDDLDATLARMRFVQVTLTLAVLAALGVVAWWVLRLGVRPLTEMAATADAIAAGDLSRRVADAEDGTEAGRLSTAFNTMLGTIEDALRQRAESEARVRRFAADASHELRTPLTSIRGYTELWQAGGLRSEAELADAMRRVNEEAQRMGALVEDLLLLARMDQDQRLERAPVRLDVLATDAVNDARAVDPDRPIGLLVEPCTVEGDEGALRQVVGNLVTNALVHTPPRTVVRVSVTAADDGKVRLDVADEGPGMPPDVAERVFERFYRADPARARAQGGSGLGLSIVAAIAELHGGRASVESTVGEGSRFTVELPAKTLREV